MSIRKTVSVMAVLMSLLLILLCGCAGLNDVELSVYEVNEYRENDYEAGDNEVNGVEIGEEFSVEPISLVIKNVDNYKDEIVQHIISSRNVSRDDEDFNMYSNNNIQGLREFYYPIVKIDGYKLYCVEITQYSMHFYFAPDSESEKEYSFMYDTGIELLIRRMEWVDESNPMKVIIEQIGDDFLTDDKFIYEKDLNCVTAQIGNTWFSLRVPKKLNEYSFLREVCLEIIDTSEIVRTDS